jgi:hypothetical protein
MVFPVRAVWCPVWESPFTRSVPEATASFFFRRIPKTFRGLIVYTHVPLVIHDFLDYPEAGWVASTGYPEFGEKGTLPP